MNLNKSSKPLKSSSSLKTLNKTNLTIEKIKALGKEKTRENFVFLIEEFNQNNQDKNQEKLSLLRREIASSIGRYYKIYPDEVIEFIENHYQKTNLNLDIIYQFMRTALYLKNEELIKKIYYYYHQNEYLLKMIKYYFFRKENNLPFLKNILTPDDYEEIVKEYQTQDIQMFLINKKFNKDKNVSCNNKSEDVVISNLFKETKTTEEWLKKEQIKNNLFIKTFYQDQNQNLNCVQELAKEKSEDQDKNLHKNQSNNQKSIQKITNSGMVISGDSEDVLKHLKENTVDLIFTSPPYYNARDYSQYLSHQDYVNKMKKVINECIKVLKPNRYIIINISPVITKRAGREFESQRLPLHVDFHNILRESGCEFVDEIIWEKPEASVVNRNGNFQQNQMSLNYKPNNVNEYILVYKKSAPFLMDEVIKGYKIKNVNLNIQIDLNKENKFESSNIWKISPKSSLNHSAVFPEELCDRIIKYYSAIGDVLLDPFAGSGTMGKVAMDLNRNFLLIEKNNDYYQVIKERFKDL